MRMRLQNETEWERDIRLRKERRESILLRSCTLEKNFDYMEEMAKESGEEKIVKRGRPRKEK